MGPSTHLNRTSHLAAQSHSILIQRPECQCACSNQINSSRKLQNK
uniref:Uncharacterized protein n=1 Tax=Anguilla anguilla TaxID=7936 RepID=A0A0E9R5X0_ANGAN